MSGSGEEKNAVEGVPTALRIGPPLLLPSAFPQGAQPSPGMGREHHNLSLMIAIININVEDTSDQNQL